jgi:hypothetical protein
MYVAVHDMQIRPADAAGRDLDQQLARSGHRQRPLDQPERLARPVELHGAHHRHGRDLANGVIPAKAGTYEHGFPRILPGRRRSLVPAFAGMTLIVIDAPAVTGKA